ncbi:MAG: GDP-mannose 4,6-dehydratase [Candidatus Thiosymbion ectosymbiont of Robbea hypermnestra]|nr:GDP-mannose 4,6-dehydratase [Candidatus Thiosymbion ectosymbiont of Robbea hypermnestra]
MKQALITGITGQDGSYLAELLLEKGYRVFGLIRRVASEDKLHRMSRILDIVDDIELIPGSLESYPSIYRVISAIKPDEVYHLAAQSFVSYSFEDEFSTFHSNVNGTHYILSALKEIVPDVRFYFAASSEMFGKVREVPQNELTPFHPRSIYAISKVVGFDLTRNYREAYNLFACNGILYNHESPRRGFEFVTRKITYHAARIKAGLTDRLELGNLDAKRDWGHAKDYVKAMWLMLQQDTPDDYVVCSGETHSVREFCEKAFGFLGMDSSDFVVLNKDLFRPAEVDVLLGDCSKAKARLGWEPDVSFDGLIEDMVTKDLEAVGRTD